MTAPNRTTLWAEVLVDELVANGVEAVCVSPGSRSTPLTVACARHSEIDVLSHLDERSSAFFALGRARQTGIPTPLVCTSGTAAANFHPAVLEASESRVPLLALTADRPPELRDSGANQTADQVKLYGDAVRLYRELPEPEADDRKLRSLRVTVSRALSAATGTNPGPVHLNVPFEKPLEPTLVEGDVPADFGEQASLAVEGRDGPFVTTTQGSLRIPQGRVRDIAKRLSDADRGLLVCGPADSPTPKRAPLARLAEATGFPVLADPLSGHRFGHSPDACLVCGGYDSYLDGRDWPEPDVVVRFGASPTSKVLRKYLADAETDQYVVDLTGGWPEAEFTATDLVSAAPTWFADTVVDSIDTTAGLTPYARRFEEAEDEYWDVVASARAEQWFEGGVLGTVAEETPPGSTVFVSNSMPVRDLDRFGQPRDEVVRVFGNRGVSGIDGIVSTGLGAGSVSDGPLVIVIGDLAYYHDMNGLLALERCGVEATIVLVDNDGGGIFHKLPIEEFDPPFTEQFKTPHGVDFSGTETLYDLTFRRCDGRPSFLDAFERSLETDGTDVLSVAFDSALSHRFREEVHDRVHKEIHG